MITVEVSMRGLQLDVLAEEVSGDLQQKLIERLADVAWSAAFFEAPWKTGYLAQSITKEVEAFRATISPLAQYAVFVEKGTAPHEIKPLRARALRFETVGGDLVFTQLVNHPGTRANPFMQRAAEQTASQAPGVFEELWEKEVQE